MKVRKVLETKNLAPPKKRVCAYVRVSSEKDAQMESLDNQQAYFKRKYEKDESCEFVGIFSDSGISGTKEKRPEFQRMLSMCRAGKIDLIHTKSVSRFARNTVTVLSVSREMKERGIDIYFEEQNINTLSSEGELLLTLLASFAQAEATDMSENQKWAIQKKFESGEAMINTNRFMGYDKDEEGNLVINEAEAKTVRMIFQRYLDGLGSYRIAKELNRMRIPTITGSTWHESTVRGMLKNEKYKGDCILQKYYTPKMCGNTVLNKGAVKSFYIEKNHEPIVSAKMWEEVQLETRRRAEERNIDTKDTKKFANRHRMTGMLQCPYCGKNLRRHHAYKRYDWTCSTYIDHGKNACKGIRVPEFITEDWNLTEPTVVKEVTIDGKKHYSYSTEGELQDTKSFEHGEENKDGSILPSVDRARRTVIKL